MKKKLHELVQMQKYYFNSAKDEITRNNLRMMTLSSLMGLVLLGVLIFITPYIVKGWKPTIEYVLLLPILLSAFVFSFFYSKKHRASYFLVQLCCAVFYFLLMTQFIAISVFPYPSDPQTFVTISIMFIPVLFILPPTINSALIIVTGAGFVILSALYRPWEVAAFDIFATITAVFFSHIIIVTTGALRARDYAARMKYLTLSQTDQLTGILNKHACEDACKAYLSKRNGEKCALFVIDVDDLKTINDSLGHSAGDVLLEHIGATLMSSFRSSDIVGRIGGDEFCALMKGLRDDELAERKARAICEIISETSLEKLNINVTVSIGVALPGEENVGFYELFKVADDTLYSSKNTGKNRHAVTIIRTDE